MRLCCRKNYRPRRFLVWLVPWLVVGVIVGITCEFAWLLLPRYLAGSGPPILALLPRLALIGLCEAGILYVLNLPFMILAFRCPAVSGAIPAGSSSARRARPRRRLRPMPLSRESNDFEDY